MKRNRIWLIALGLLLASSLLLLRRGSSDTVELLASPTFGDFRATVATTGELQAKSSVKIYGPSNARQARIHEMSILRLVPEGTVVSKGEFVAELDRSDLNNKIKDAEIDLQKAESQFTQTRLDTSLTLSKAREDRVSLRYAMEEARLRSEESIYEPPSVRRKAEIDYEKAKRNFDQSLANYSTQVQQAVAKMQEVQASLTKSVRAKEELQDLGSEFTITAPENGMVIYQRDWRGQKLTSGGKINAWDPVVATLPDLSIMESRTYVNEVDIQRVKQGQPVQVGLDADPSRRLTGVVTEIANIGEQRPNSDAKVFEVKIEITEADSTLRPAMTTSNVITVAELADVLYVPLETVHTTDSLSFVFVKEGGPLRREVRLGLMNENEVVIEAGLERNATLYLATPEGGEDTELVRLPEDERVRPQETQTAARTDDDPESESSTVIGEQDGRRRGPGNEGQRGQGDRPARGDGQGSRRGTR